MPDILLPDWPAPANVCAISTTRQAGVSVSPYNSFNLAMHVGDDTVAVQQNRQTLQQQSSMPEQPVWLNQVHANQVVQLSSATAESITADAAFTAQPGVVCSVMTADCLPLLLCNTEGTQVAAVHAGWRGLAAGVIENALSCFSTTKSVLAWLGPAISVEAFEVGEEVYQIFTSQSPQAAQAFIPHHNKWRADLYLLARQRLQQAGVTQIYGGQYCTYRQADQFFSYRRDGQTGRMASCIWLT